MSKPNPPKPRGGRSGASRAGRTPKRNASGSKSSGSKPKVSGHQVRSSISKSGVVTTVTSRDGKPTQVTRTGFSRAGSRGRPRTQSAKLPLTGKEKWSF